MPPSLCSPRTHCSRPVPSASNLARLAESAFERRGDYDSLLFEGRWHGSAKLFDRSRRMHSKLADEMIAAAVLQFLPAAGAGVLLTAVLFRFAPQCLWMTPGLWQITFGLGVFASCRFLPRGLLLVGGWYVASGLACLAYAQGPHALSAWTMGAPFGVGQLLVAAVLRFAGEQDD